MEFEFESTFKTSKTVSRSSVYITESEFHTVGGIDEMLTDSNWRFNLQRSTMVLVIATRSE